MSEEKPEIASDHQNALIGFNLADPSAGGVYANDSHANVLSADVVITFGDGTKDPDGHLRTAAKVIMSHATFMGFVEYLRPRYEFIQAALGERPKTIGEAFNADPERIKALLKAHIFKSESEENANVSTIDNPE
jgi:hypothetical protein